MLFPEVPLEARLAFLRLPWPDETYRAASFVSMEIEQAYNSEIFRDIDMLSINRDEAAALAGDSDNSFRRTADIVQEQNPDIDLFITDGVSGAYYFYGNSVRYLKPPEVDAKSSAGAGDAFFAGIIIGHIIGLPSYARVEISSFELAMVLSALSVESFNTINFDITFDLLKKSLMR